MPLVSTQEIVQGARDAGRPALAFNFVTLEQAEGIALGAERAGLPVILQISENAVRAHREDVGPLAALALAVARSATADLSLHLDHVKRPSLWESAAQAGFSSVMVDAAELPHAENVAVTAAATRLLHDQGLTVEAELGEVGGKDGAHAPGVRTDPEDAADFVAATGVDALAVAVGSSHAMTTRTARLDLDLIARLRDAVGVPLVLHGSSGVPAETLRAAVGAGMVKINIGTLLGVAFTRAVRRRLDADATLVDPRRYLGDAREAVAAAVVECVQDLGGPPGTDIVAGWTADSELS